VFYDANDFARAALRSGAAMTYLYSEAKEFSRLLVAGESPADSLFFATLDLFGRSLRKMWCLDEAEQAFCFGIRAALFCPHSYGWAQEYFSRWVSIFDRRDALKRAGGTLVHGGKEAAHRRPHRVRAILQRWLVRPSLERPIWAIKTGPGEQMPGEDTVRQVRKYISSMEAGDPFGDQLLCMLREIASQGNQMPDFKAISNRVRRA
jgi:hypothetical protein